MPCKERWPEQALQVIKEEMLAEVASPAIPPGLQLKTKQEEKTQARVQSRERESANVRARTTTRSGVWSCLYSTLPTPFRSLHWPPPAAPAVCTPQWTTFTATTALVVVDGSTTIYHNSPADAIRSKRVYSNAPLYPLEFLRPF